jgi:hypothetical protein
MKVERKILKSISELSIFKLVIVIYLILFILFVIIFAVGALIGWAVLATSGIGATDIFKSISSLTGLDMSGIMGGLGGGILGIILFVVVGLVASVFAAAIATLFAWIFNVVLRIVGGIELRFALSKNTNADAYPLNEKPQ